MPLYAFVFLIEVSLLAGHKTVEHFKKYHHSRNLISRARAVSKAEADGSGSQFPDYTPSDLKELK